MLFTTGYQNLNELGHGLIELLTGVQNLLLAPGLVSEEGNTANVMPAFKRAQRKRNKTRNQ